MIQKFLYLILPLSLTGCIGTWISGNTGYLNDDYPDIRSVPEREEASAPRGLHLGEEKLSREFDFAQLQLEREKIKARDEALREEEFSDLIDEDWT